MQDSAAAAALSSGSTAQPSSHSILDEDGRLSTASAATSLKYARAQDLPSYPSAGGVPMSSAGAAASLATSNQKPFEHWKPDSIPAANRAAMLAKDHKVNAMWQPPHEASAAGSKAALMAHANPTQVEAMQPKKTASVKSTTPSAAYDTPENTHRKALMAANAASHNRRRSGSLPATTAVKPTKDESWAMKAATKSHRGVPSPAPVSSSPASSNAGLEAARIQNIAKNNVDRRLYTASPPVSIEVQEKNRQDTLRASAVAMAQKMYAIQQKHIDEAAGKNDSQALAASRARSSTFTGSTANGGDNRASTPAGYENLEEAARRLAQERLAKIHDEHAEYRSYYGQTSPNRNRLSMRLGRRASSVADDDSDEEQSRKIRSQMSIFQSRLAEVDSRKRQQDRDTLLEIAHRNVDKQISQMDERVFQDTGKASPAQMEKWEKAAREKAQRDSDERMQHAGKVHIGGGKYLDQSELDAIAKARLQPTLDDIADKAEKQRAKDEEERLERERKEQLAARDKARAAETAAQVKAESERQKQEAKAAKDEEKRLKKDEELAEKGKRDEERRVQKEQEAAEKERKRLEKEEKRKSRDSKPGRFSSLLGRSSGAGGGVVSSETEAAESSSTPAQPSSSLETGATQREPATSTYHDQVTSPTSDSQTPVVTRLEPAVSSPGDTQLTRDQPSRKSLDGKTSTENRPSFDEDVDESGSPSKSRVKSWMKVHFRGKSNTQKEGGTSQTDNTATTEKENRRSTEHSDSVPRTNSERDVALAGRVDSRETTDMYTSGREVSPERSGDLHDGDRSPSISSLSSEYPEDTERPVQDFSLGTTAPAKDEDDGRGRKGLRRRLMKKIKPGKERSEATKVDDAQPVKSNTTDEADREEARDHFAEEKLAPPPPLSAITGEGSGRMTLSPKGSRERSRFTEEL